MDLSGLLMLSVKAMALYLGVSIIFSAVGFCIVIAILLHALKHLFD